MSSVYIHIPFCRSKCDYCDFFSVPCGLKDLPDGYIEALKNELKWRFSDFSEIYGKNGIRKDSENCSDNQKISTLYVGGGTPSLLTPFQIENLMNFLKSYGFTSDAEITIEANPRDITEEKLKCWWKNGINRLSVGIQALEEKTLTAVKRQSSSSDVFTALDLIKRYWPGIFSADIICALPGQTEIEFLKGLEILLEYEPSHVSMYSLTIESETPLGRAFDSGRIEYDFAAADEMWLKGKDFLEKSGYELYEVSNFFKKSCGKPSAHNSVYWKLEDYYGAGSGGTGSFYGKNGIRWTNTKNIRQYIEFWNNSEKKLSAESVPEEIEELSLSVQSFEFFMMGLRTIRGISLENYRKRFDSEIPEPVKKIMEKWCSRKKAAFRQEKGETFFALLEEGIIFLNEFLEELLESDCFKQI